MVRRIFPLFLLVGLVPVLCCAQNSQDPFASQASPNTPAASNAAPEKPKKIWTNEDVKTAGSVSVVGDPKNQKYPMTKPPDPATVAKYRNNLQKLQAQLADVNKQLKSFQEFSQGKPVSEGGRDMSHGYSRTPVDQQIVKLTGKKKQLEDQIDALYEESRKKGIDSGLLK